MADIMRRSFTPMQNLRREVDRLFTEFFPTREEGDSDFLSAVWSPRMDLSETDDTYYVKVDLPGLTKEDITVSVKNHQLIISGERKSETRKEGENFLRVERSHGSFYRSIPIPETAKVDEVAAKFKDGVLNIHIPKTAEEKARKIEVA